MRFLNYMIFNLYMYTSSARGFARIKILLKKIYYVLR